jgi:hypothetical protein
MIIIGLVLLGAALVIGVAGVLSNSGDGHALTHGFAVFGYHVTGDTGTLFLHGVVVGAVGLLGLGLLLAGARRTARRGRTARSDLRASRRETAAVTRDRDELAETRRTDTRAHEATPADPAAPRESGGSEGDGERS